MMEEQVAASKILQAVIFVTVIFDVIIFNKNIIYLRNFEALCDYE